MERFKKPEAAHIRGMCVKCKKNPQKSKGPERYMPICGTCAKRRYPSVIEKEKKRTLLRQRPWVAYKKDLCERCGFIPEDACQLDVDHKDGNRKNNDPENYQTLCANCHRLKTKLAKDHLTRY